MISEGMKKIFLYTKKLKGKEPEMRFDSKHNNADIK